MAEQPPPRQQNDTMKSRCDVHQKLKPPLQPPESTGQQHREKARKTQWSESMVCKDTEWWSTQLTQPWASGQTWKHISPEPLLQNNRDDHPAIRGLVDIQISDTSDPLLGQLGVLGLPTFNNNLPVTASPSLRLCLQNFNSTGLDWKLLWFGF